MYIWEYDVSYVDKLRIQFSTVYKILLAIQQLQNISMESDFEILTDQGHVSSKYF